MTRSTTKDSRSRIDCYNIKPLEGRIRDRLPQVTGARSTVTNDARGTVDCAIAATIQIKSTGFSAYAGLL